VQKEEKLVKKTILLVVGLMAFATSPIMAQEVVITGFPLGVGATVNPDIFVPYGLQLQELADLLSASPSAWAIIVGQADGARYKTGSDAKNPGLSLGRSHALRNVLVNTYAVDSSQILIQSSEVSVIGDQYRSVSVRLKMPVVVPQIVAKPVPVITVKEDVAPVVQHSTYYYEQMTLRLGAGISATPFGPMPTVAGAVAWNHTVSLEMMLGHTFWNGSFQFEGANLQTWRRMVGGRVNVFPWQGVPVGFIGGWMRMEELAQAPHEFVKLSEGPVLGVGVVPIKHLVVEGLYNPARHRTAGEGLAVAKDSQFLLSFRLFKDFGGAK
jgi:hypothetical protein